MMDSLRRVVRRAVVVGLAALIVLGAGPVWGDSECDYWSDGASPASRSRSALPSAMLLRSAVPRQQPAVGQLTLRNTTRGDMRVEVRTGPGPSCEALNPGPVLVLPPGKRWLIAARHPVCWRRALTLALPVTAWTPWQRQNLTAGQRAQATP